MEWLHSAGFYWTLIGTLANISLIAFVTSLLIYLWFGKREHTWGATLTFVAYVVLFALEPTPAVKAYMANEPIEPQGALRTLMFVISIILLLIKTVRIKP